ncbi:hypothetical protein CDG76_06490 [Nostoc sp. 'Peltigera membranacea cyanobiont' 210A]|uniref:non-ribosomal peptide synthetase n=1 Tax=Nostoc sp. 'Peltigera membranacea cyanobiont' 210A TaxID=2014529 RepID=UPI000B95B793|nr:non-ribosomal peptide synthetase [Nostoc sp. 'Peltigera membranacea cyanobiont' 210A]OYD96431.1 hypothetical protein CDG76_06490 [Nostoc sp. 'Peltigera membranacea cyanobiont' 210A]
MDRIVKISSPLSYGQEAMWFIYELAPESIAYNIYITVKINSYLNIATVIRVWEKIIGNHPILRTIYTLHEGKPVQQVNQQQKFNLELIDATDWSEDHLREKIFAITDCPFNLEKDSVLRVNLFTRSAQEHILLLTMHHIAGDMWSFDLLVSEFQALYVNEIEQVSQDKTEAAADYLTKHKSYLEFVRWQSEMLSSSRGEKLWQYWQKQLAGELPILNLLADKPRPTVQTYQGAVHISNLDEELIQKLKHLALASGRSLYQILLAAFYVQLYRYTNQTDILIGSPMRGRWGKEFKEIVGYFVNLNVLRVSVQENATFTEFLAQVSKTVREAQKHQDYPFSLLAEQLQPERDPSRSPLCQVSFTWQAHRWYEPTENSLHSEEQVLHMEPYLLGHQRGADFDLNLMVMEAQGVLQLCWQYNTDLFEATTITRMAGHFVTLLEGIVANPQEQIWQLPLLTKVEQQQLLIEWNDTGVDFPQDKCIHQLFEEQVEHTPDAVAVVFENQQLTYRQLNSRANQLAHHLKSLGVGADVLVGLCVERSLEMVVGLLGILKAGGAYVPLDPEYPQERLTFMLEDTQLSVILTQEKLVKKLGDCLRHSFADSPEKTQRDGKASVICLDSNWDIINQQTQHNPTNSIKADNIAYVMYTSGSTGQPKGVSIIHQGIVRLVKQTDYVSFSDQEVFLQVAPISFDAATFEIWGCLLNGGELVIYPSNTPSINELGQVIEQYQVTTLWLTAGLFHLMVDENIDALKPLRQLLAGGDVLSVPHVQKFLQTVENCRLINGYGPTENTTFTCCYQIPKSLSPNVSVPIGRPIANTQVYILDKNLQPAPIGVPGELHIGGTGLARGYFNRQELTQEKFIPNPFEEAGGRRQEAGGSKLYKTGDLARYLPDGNIQYLGRIDNQVKIRGLRIELGEIEEILSQHRDVQVCCVILREDTPSDKRLVAYVVAHQDCTPTISELRQFLKARLPEYMLPTGFTILEALPLTPNGKVDRRALPAPESRSGIEVSLVAPRTHIEEILASIWVQVLRVEQVGIYDNFFELGGDSILSIQIVSKAKQSGLQLTSKQLFQYQTIADLSAVTSTYLPLLPEQGLVTGSVSLTPIQHWFFEQNLPDLHHYNQSVMLEVSPDLKPELLKQIVSQLLVHHDALRLKFVPSETGWQQINVSQDERVPVTVLDLSEIPSNKQQTAISTASASLQASLNLSQAAIVQVALFQMGVDQPNRLLFIVHHLAVDGVSWRILLEDFVTAYQQLSLGKEIQLPPKTTAFKDWSHRLKSYAQTETVRAELDYWQAQSWSSVVALPVDYSLGKEANTMDSAAQVTVSLSEEQTRALLQEVPSAYNTQINDALLTALVQSFARFYGMRSLFIDLEGHGREELFEDINLSRTVGWFTTKFPILLKLTEVDHPGEALKLIKEQLRRLPNRGIGYGLLQYLNQDSATRLKLKSFPQAEVSFNYLGQFDQIQSEAPLLGWAKESISLERSVLGNRSHLLEVNGLIVGDKLQLDWTYSKNIHKQSTVENLAFGFIEALKSLIAHCRLRQAKNYTPSDFPEAELNQEELDKIIAQLTK